MAYVSAGPNTMCRVITRRIHTVPKEEQTNAFKLFNHKFSVRVPQVFVMNMDTVERMGRPTSGNKKFDDQVRSQYTPMLLSPADLADLHQRGAPVEFESDQKAAEVYSIIRGHLVDWDNYIRESFVQREIPLEDLKLLDEYAEKLYRYSARVLSQSMLDSARMTMSERFGSRRGLRINTPEKSQQRPSQGRYRPMIDSIMAGAEGLMKRSRY